MKIPSSLIHITYKQIIIAFILVTLFYTRFVGLSWGLPYPMHPDERNMAVSIEQLSCPDIQSGDCLNPHFFAYGQFPLYIGYFAIKLLHLLSGDISKLITYTEAVMALRIISALSSVFTFWILVKIFDSIAPFISRSVHKVYGADVKSVLKDPFVYLVSFLYIFSAGLIQFSHFGTTESLLMLFYVLLMYFSLELFAQRYMYYKYFLLTSLVLGLATATKVSSLLFTFIPVFTLTVYFFRHEDTRKLLRLCFSLVNMLGLACILSVLFSPYNFISFPEFLSSMYYESDIATGRYLAFYIRQFVGTMPVLFQFIYIFPYALGWGVMILFILGFLFLPFNKEVNLLRIAFLSFFIPSAFLFAKWTRFMTPVFPIILLFASLFLFKAYYRLRLQFTRFHGSNQGMQLVSQRMIIGLFAVLVFLMCLPGIAYLAVYTTPDVRYKASDWVYQNMKEGSYILSETANVIDVPISTPGSALDLYANKTYKYISFNFYDLDVNYGLQDELSSHIDNADYIFVPSRRVFMNHTCFNEKLISQKENRNLINDCAEKSDGYFTINSYYNRLFSGDLGFEKVAEFTSYPRIELFGKTLLEFPDEAAEESWAIFDHPVVRIYKKNIVE